MSLTLSSETAARLLIRAAQRAGTLTVLGGPGSGHFGHAGRPGSIGGSVSGTVTVPSGILDAITTADGGFTYHPLTGTSPTTGFALSLHKDRERILPAKDVTAVTLAQYVVDNADLLTQEQNYLGGWHNPVDGKAYLDVSTVVDSADEAARLGREAHQLAYFDLEKGQSVAIDPAYLKAAAAYYRQTRVGTALARRRDRFGRSALRASGHGRGTGGGGADSDSVSDARFRPLGSATSGHWGHSGVKGQLGGSAPGTGAGGASHGDQIDQLLALRARLARLTTGVTSAEITLHPTTLRAAAVTADVLEEMQAKGYTMPASVEVSQGTGPRGEITYRTPSYDAPIGQRTLTPHLKIQLPYSIPEDANLDDVAKFAFGGTERQWELDGVGGVQPAQGTKTDAFTIRSMRDIVVHEMGHVQAGWRTKPGSTPVDRLTFIPAASKVSDYAMTNEDEFLAEGFTKLYRGETLPPDAAALYDARQGPKVR